VPDAPDWTDICVEPFAALILGQRGGGKTALGHRLLEVFGENEERDAYILGFPEHLRDRLPEWIEVLPPTTGMDEWPENSVVLIHEAHMLIHARRSQDGANVELDELVTISRHKDSDIIFETQQSQRLDRNAVTSVDAVIFREPALMQADFERSGMKKIVRKADDYFEQFVETVDTGDYVYREQSLAVKKHAYVHSGRFIGGYPHEIGLADHWSEDISKAYAEVSPESAEGGSGDSGIDEETQEMIDAIATFEADNRPFEYGFKGAEARELGFHGSKMASLIREGYARNVDSSNNSPNAYRLTDEGWEVSNVDVSKLPEEGAA